ncbi:energy transducer TonB [Flavobacterium sp. NKUCC04_CG]|uniref:energy transducer TonB n=1 Tax=Flavobacterium sp. NKUCC04_CG TaxID=2842121 RepID=UPI001C5B2588|nr:energy transducer TonB [Flavobacterium sp. NKUCC04_CG]MBW3518119.1 energy transducer TonB [Flavobacterium sp. NKUCC04_CG]
MSKLNIFRKEWLDVVFENRNKKYGAYQLRSENPRTTTFALFIGTALLALGISSPLILKSLDGSLGDNIVPVVVPDVVVWDALPPAAALKKLEEVQPIADEPVTKKSEGAASSVKTKRHVVFTVTDDPSKITEEVTKNADLIDANPGSANIDGVTGGVIDTDGLNGQGAKKGIGGSDEGTTSEVFIAVQYKAEPVGGFDSFTKLFISRFRTPDMSSDIKKIQVIVKFIVEKDGSLSDIVVLRDPGYGAGKEALRVLSAMPKWKAAVQNNRKVRSQFTLPITIQVH